MALNLVELNAVLGTALTLVSVIAGLFAKLNVENKYAKALLTACFAAEKAIDVTAYDSDGTLNLARENMAILILHKLVPKVNEDSLRGEIGALLAIIHTHANDGIADSQLIALPTNPPTPADMIRTVGEPPPAPTPASVQVTLHEGTAPK